MYVYVSARACTQMAKNIYVFFIKILSTGTPREKLTPRLLFHSIDASYTYFRINKKKTPMRHRTILQSFIFLIPYFFR